LHRRFSTGWELNGFLWKKFSFTRMFFSVFPKSPAVRTISPFPEVHPKEGIYPSGMEYLQSDCKNAMLFHISFTCEKD
jgi:hypothetical protein